MSSNSRVAPDVPGSSFISAGGVGPNGLAWGLYRFILAHGLWAATSPGPAAISLSPRWVAFTEASTAPGTPPWSVATGRPSLSSATVAQPTGTHRAPARSSATDATILPLFIIRKNNPVPFKILYAR